MESNENDPHQAYSKTCMPNKTSKLLNINNKIEQNNVVREINFRRQKDLLLTFDLVNHFLPPSEN